MAQGTITAHEVPALPYAYNALEPHIDEQTMHLHHDKHHAAYVTKLNGAIEKHPELGSKSPEELLRNLGALPLLPAYDPSAGEVRDMVPHHHTPGIPDNA